MTDKSAFPTSNERVYTADIEACYAWLIQSGNPLAASRKMAAMIHELLERRRADETSDDSRDAARYRYIRSDVCGLTLTHHLLIGGALDRAIDAERGAVETPARHARDCGCHDCHYARKHP